MARPNRSRVVEAIESFRYPQEKEDNVTLVIVKVE
jgi:hypothetical protein